MAIALKGYPILFLLLGLAEKKPRFILLVLAIALALTVSSWAIMGGPLLGNIARTFTSLSTFMDIGVRHGGVMRFNISLFSAIALVSPWGMKLTANAEFMLIYNCGCVCALCALAVYLVKSEGVFWRRVSLIVIAMLLLPQALADYRLIFVLIPLGLYVSNGRHFRYEYWYGWLFGCLLLPKSFLILLNRIGISACC